MNQKFFQLPNEKQKNIINAGFRIFAENTYKKSPMSAIAEEASISKSLLFHYFTNKKDLYFYLYDYAIDYMLKEVSKDNLKNETDFFEIINKSLVSKCRIMREHMYLNLFLLKAYFEKDASVIEELDKRRTYIIDLSITNIYDWIDRSKFKNPDDLEQLLNVVINYGDGYMWQKITKPPINIDEMEKEVLKVMEFLKRGYYKEEYL